MSLQRLAKQWKQQALLPVRRSPIAASLQAKLPSPILQLQQTLGNQRVAQLMRARRVTSQGKIIRVQRKLTVGIPNDQYEQEADRIARQVISVPKGTPANTMTMQRVAPPEGTMEEDKGRVLQAGPLAAGITTLEQKPTSVNDESKDEETPIQMRSEASRVNNHPLEPINEEEETEPIQAKSSAPLAGSFQAAEDVEAKLNQNSGGGTPLQDSVRSYMEAGFGMDFSRVRTHTDSAAVEMNRDVGAKAFTHGADIYYGANTDPGHLELTAHELTHVVQQTGSLPLPPKRHEDTTSSVYQTRRSPSAFNTAGTKEKERNPAGFFRETVFSPGFIAPQRRIQRQFIPPELEVSVNVRWMKEGELQHRYDLLVETMEQFNASSPDNWWLEAELSNISNELARRQALKAGRTFGDTEIEKMKDYFIKNAKSADPDSCIACMNHALRLLLNKPKQKVGSEVEKTMARLQESGFAGEAKVIEFKDKRGRITKGTLYPNELNESAWDAIMEMMGGDVGWSVFGMSLMHGNHSVTLTLDNNYPAAPHLYWSDQWSTKGGWKEYNKESLDREITTLTQGWWNKQPQNRKFNTRVTLWRLNQ